MDHSVPINEDASAEYQLQEVKGSFSFDESPFACIFLQSPHGDSKHADAKTQ
jgi:hypothetical protein